MTLEIVEHCSITALMILCPYEIFSPCPINSSQCFANVFSISLPLQPLNLLQTGCPQPPSCSWSLPFSIHSTSLPV